MGEAFAPISLARPTALELEASALMEEMLRRNGQYATQANMQQREETLGRISEICKDWSRRATAARAGIPVESLNEESYPVGGAKIFTFGSYRLGVYNDGSDMDTLCVGPQSLSRDDFFDTLLPVLAKTKGVTKCTPVRDAFVPLIKLEFDGFSIDLLYAPLAVSRVTDDLDVQDDNLLRALDDDRTVRSLNGSRVANSILRAVPNVDTFKSALRCIKLWAKNRGIYANKVGFLGGISWAILVARTCMYYPNACPALIVNKMFKIFSVWNWPDPVMLCPIIPETPNASMAMKVWNPKQYPKDRYHKMPIITPAYPSMNSTYNVSESTMELMKQELKRGLDITKKMFDSATLMSPTTSPDARRQAIDDTWTELLSRTEFFTRYKYFVEVKLVCRDHEEFEKWQGWVEARVRVLIENLEATANVWCAVPLLEPFEQPEVDCFHGTFYYLGVQFNIPKPATPGQPAQKVSVNLSPAVQDFKLRLSEFREKTETMAVEVEFKRRSDLPKWVLSEEAERARKSLKKSTAAPDALAPSAVSEACAALSSVLSPIKPPQPEAPTTPPAAAVGTTSAAVTAAINAAAAAVTPVVSLTPQATAIPTTTTTTTTTATETAAPLSSPAQSLETTPTAPPASTESTTPTPVASTN